VTLQALIIDDNELNLDVLAKLLEIEGAAPFTVTSPQQIDETLEQAQRVDIVFLDLEIPNYDGFDILRSLKADPRVDGAPIVACTVHTSEIDEVRAAGFDSFLGKPLDAKRFSGQLQRILDGHQVWEV